MQAPTSLQRFPMVPANANILISVADSNAP